jgi:hypothetical protein
MLFARCPKPNACQANPIINHFFVIKEAILEFDVVTQHRMLRLPRPKLLDYFFTPKIAALATRNLTTVLAGILVFCCVFGLNPCAVSSSALRAICLCRFQYGRSGTMGTAQDAYIRLRAENLRSRSVALRMTHLPSPSLHVDLWRV